MRLDRECIHCQHSDQIGPIRTLEDGYALYSSSADFCTLCGRPWIGISGDCEHCGTDENARYEDIILSRGLWQSYCIKLDGNEWLNGIWSFDRAEAFWARNC